MNTDLSFTRAIYTLKSDGTVTEKIIDTEEATDDEMLKFLRYGVLPEKT